MQYNIFKIKNKKELLEHMQDKGYEKCGNEIESNASDTERPLCLKCTELLGLNNIEEGDNKSNEEK